MQLENRVMLLYLCNFNAKHSRITEFNSFYLLFKKFSQTNKAKPELKHKFFCSNLKKWQNHFLHSPHTNYNFT